MDGVESDPGHFEIRVGSLRRWRKLEVEDVPVW